MSETSFSAVEFVEVAAFEEDRAGIERLLISNGFNPLNQVEGRAMTLWSRDGANVLLNFDEDGYAADFRARQGTGPVSIGLKVDDIHLAWRRAIDSGAWPVGDYVRPDLPFPALFGPDDVLIYFTDSWRDCEEMRWRSTFHQRSEGAGLSVHLAEDSSRREWEFWLEDMVCLRPHLGESFGRRAFGNRGELSFGASPADADLIFESSQAIRGISFRKRRPLALVTSRWSKADEQISIRNGRGL